MSPSSARVSSNSFLTFSYFSSAVSRSAEEETQAFVKLLQSSFFYFLFFIFSDFAEEHLSIPFRSNFHTKCTLPAGYKVGVHALHSGGTPSRVSMLRFSDVTSLSFSSQTLSD